MTMPLNKVTVENNRHNHIDGNHSYPDVAKHSDHVALSYAQLSTIEKLGASSFYFLDLDKLRQNYHDLEHAFKEHYPHSQIAYSFKTNYAPKICETLKELGCWAEVVSEMEYNIATQRVGYPANNIIVNGPVHEPHFIERVLKEGALFNVDAWYLLDHVKEVCQRNPEQQFRIGVRLSYDIIGGGFSRFGIDSSEQNLNRLANWESSINNCRIEGFHSHFSNSSRSLESFNSRAEGLLSANKYYFKKSSAHFINIGGGFFGDMPSSLADQMRSASNKHIPNFSDYAKSISKPLKWLDSEHHKTTLFLEPGTALIANTMVFACKVYDLKKIDGRTVAMVNGSNHNINHKWQGEALPLQIVRKDPERLYDKQGEFDIVGNTCIEKDILRSDVEGNVEIGDYIIFQYMGGYTNVLKQPFINPCQPIYAWGNEQFFVVKRQETVSDILASYT